MNTGRITEILGLSAVLLLGLAPQAVAQDRAGVVTTLEGKVTVTRATLPEPAALKFRDDIFVKDRIVTGKDAIARILLGGRAIVTVREHSVVTITEVPGVSTVDVTGGRVAVAVAREKMRPGDVVEVKTPNAVAGIRGTVIVAEVFSANRSVITVLKGVIDVTRLDAGRLMGGPLTVNALQRVTVVGAGPVAAPQAVTADSAQRLGSEFRMAPPRTAPPAAAAPVNQAEVERTAKYLATIAPPPPTAPPVSGKTARDQRDDDDDDDNARGDRQNKTVRSDTGKSKDNSAPQPIASKTGESSSKGSSEKGSPSSSPMAPSTPAKAGPGPIASAPTAAPAPVTPPPLAAPPPVVAPPIPQVQKQVEQNLKDLADTVRRNRGRSRDR